MKHTLNKFCSIAVLIAFVFTGIVPPQAYAQVMPLASAPTILNLPIPGTFVGLTNPFIPTIVRGLTIYPNDPFRFDFIVDEGDSNLDDQSFKKESEKLIKYFLASLTIPEDELWVNLSPYEKNRIISDSFGQTEMGRDLLAQDYMLKQLTASLMYPEEQLGKKFWDRIYQKTQSQFGTTDIPVDTFNKVWIVPQKAEIYINGNNVFVAKSRLKVLLDVDYLALNKSNQAPVINHQSQNTEIQTEIIREILIPEIEREVNEGETFANLRQIYHSSILATWYKQNLKESVFGQAYIDQNKVSGVDIKDKQINEKIYNQYLEAFKRGVYDYIKEDIDEDTGKMVPRKYFSGGAQLGEKDLARLSKSGEAEFLDFIDTRPTKKVVWEVTDSAKLTIDNAFQEESIDVDDLLQRLSWVFKLFPLDSIDSGRLRLGIDIRNESIDLFSDATAYLDIQIENNSNLQVQQAAHRILMEIMLLGMLGEVDHPSKIDLDVFSEESGQRELAQAILDGAPRALFLEKAIRDIYLEKKSSEVEHAKLTVLHSINQEEQLKQALSEAAIIIGAVFSKAQGSAQAPKLLKEDLLEKICRDIKKVIVDVASDQGGNIEHVIGDNNFVFTHEELAHIDKFGNLIIAVQNMPAAFGAIASPFLSEATQPILLSLVQNLLASDLIAEHPGLIKGISVINGRLTDEEVAKAHDLEFNGKLEFADLEAVEGYMRNIEVVGVPAELKKGETRVGIVIDEVLNLRVLGKQVIIQAGAGEKSGITDEQYREAGAEIVKTAQEVWEQADLIKKVKEPLPSEYKYFREDLVLYTYLHLANPGAKGLIEAIMDSKVTAIAYESVQWEGKTPLLTPMSRLAGYIAALWAAYYVRSDHDYRKDVDTDTGIIKPERVAAVNESFKETYKFIQENWQKLRDSEFNFTEEALANSGLNDLYKGKVVSLGGGDVGREAAYMSLLLGLDVTVSELSEDRIAFLQNEFGKLGFEIEDDLAVLSFRNLKIGDQVKNIRTEKIGEVNAFTRKRDLRNQLKDAVVIRYGPKQLEVYIQEEAESNLTRIRKSKKKNSEEDKAKLPEVRMGENVFALWRRSYDDAPPVNHQGESESLKDTHERVSRYYENEIKVTLKDGLHTIVSAHNNSLRAIAMDIFGITKEEIIKVSFPLATPIIIKLNGKGQVDQVLIIKPETGWPDEKNVNSLKNIFEEKLIPYQLIDKEWLPTLSFIEKTKYGYLIIVRHGQTITSDTLPGGGVFAGQNDVELTELGVQQALSAGKVLGIIAKRLNITPGRMFAFTSDLQRAVNTLTNVFEGMRFPYYFSQNILDLESNRTKIDANYIPIFQSTDITERHYGALQGKKHDEFLEVELPAKIKKLWENDPSLRRKRAKAISQALKDNWEELDDSKLTLEEGQDYTAKQREQLVKSLYLQRVIRTWTYNVYERKDLERDGDHSWGVPFLVMALAPMIDEEIDLITAVIMAMIHDLPEYVGWDFTPDQINADEKHRIEREDFEKLLEGFDNKDELMEIFDEYNERISVIARFVKASNELDLFLQTVIYQRRFGGDVVHIQDATREKIEQMNFPFMLALTDLKNENEEVIQMRESLIELYQFKDKDQSLSEEEAKKINSPASKAWSKAWLALMLHKPDLNLYYLISHALISGLPLESVSKLPSASLSNIAMYSIDMSDNDYKFMKSIDWLYQELDAEVDRSKLPEADPIGRLIRDLLWTKTYPTIVSEGWSPVIEFESVIEEIKDNGERLKFYESNGLLASNERVLSTLNNKEKSTLVFQSPHSLNVYIFIDEDQYEYLGPYYRNEVKEQFKIGDFEASVKLLALQHFPFRESSVRETLSIDLYAPIFDFDNGFTRLPIERALEIVKDRRADIYYKSGHSPFYVIKDEENVHSEAVYEITESNVDKAILAQPGGIDLNPAHIDFDKDAQNYSISIPISQSPIPNLNINGFAPVIIEIVPVNVPILLGIKRDEDEEGQLSYLR